MSRIKWTEEEIKDIISSYLSGISINALSKKYNKSSSAIATVLNNNKIQHRSIQESNRTKKVLTEEQKDEIIYNYCVLKQGLQTAGKKYGYTQFLTEKLLKERGVKKRTYVESKQELRKYHINDEFFKSPSSDMAYILGFLAADGNIAKKENGIFLELHQQDEEILQKIREKTQSDRKLDYRANNQGTPCVKFKVWSSEWKQDLAKYGIVPNRTFTISPPSLLPKEYRIDYIRGFFDGDGTVYSHNNKPYVSFISASKILLEWIRDELSDLGITTESFSTTTLDSGNLFYRITYSRKNITKMLYNNFYKNPNALYLKRKKDKWDELNSL